MMERLLLLAKERFLKAYQTFHYVILKNEDSVISKVEKTLESECVTNARKQTFGKTSVCVLPEKNYVIFLFS